MKNLTEINKKFFEGFDMVFHSIIGNKRIDLNDTDKIIDKLKINLISQIMISEIILNKDKIVQFFYWL